MTCAEVAPRLFAWCRLDPRERLRRLLLHRRHEPSGWPVAARDARSLLICRAISRIFIPALRQVLI